MSEEAQMEAAERHQRDLIELRAEIERLTREHYANMQAATTVIERLMHERDAVIAALKEVCDATAVPLPDPIAHSWRAFYDAACTRLTRCSNAARRGLRK